MKSQIWIAASALLLTAPLGLSKTELETLRSLCSEQERQIQHLEEENMHLRSLTGQKNRATSGLVSNPTTRQEKHETPSTDFYRIRPGDTLAKIARSNGTTVAVLAKTNGIKNPGLISVGQKIKIPGKSSDSMASAKKSTSSTPRTKNGTHIVKAGDTFYGIAKDHGLSTDELMAANPGVKASELRAGQEINLSKSQAVASAPTPALRRAASPAPTPQRASAPAAPSPSPSASPAPRKEPAHQTQEIASSTPPASQPSIRSITVNGEMTYGEFANKHGTDVGRLNDLNGLDLADATLLAKGSELYIPAQP